jgi:hypothetical protein
MSGLNETDIQIVSDWIKQNISPGLYVRSEALFEALSDKLSKAYAENTFKVYLSISVSNGHISILRGVRKLGYQYIPGEIKTVFISKERVVPPKAKVEAKVVEGIVMGELPRWPSGKLKILKPGRIHQ